MSQLSFDQIPTYVKRAICLLYEGNPKFYFEMDKELFRGLTSYVRNNLKCINSGNEVLKQIPPSDKTVANIGFKKEKTKKLLRQELKEIEKKAQKNGLLTFSAEITNGERTISFSPEELNYLFMFFGKYIQRKSGSIRSEWGKLMKELYLRIVFESMGIEKGSLESIKSLESGVKPLSGDKKELRYVLNKKFRKSNGSLEPHTKGREIDGLMYLYDPIGVKIKYLLAVEFTTTGRGNPTFQRDKANDFHNYLKNTGVVIIYTGFDLAQTMRDKIAQDVHTVFFREKKKTEFLGEFHHLLTTKLEKVGEDASRLLLSKEDASKNFEGYIKKLEVG